MARMTTSEFRERAADRGWRLTYSGPQAHFGCDSFADAVEFVAEIGRLSTELGVLPDVDLRPNGVTVRIWPPGSRDDDEGMPASALELALSISAAASTIGLAPDPSAIQTTQIAVMHHPDVDVRPFWVAALGYEPRGESFAGDPLRRGPTLWFDPFDPERPGRGRTHIDVSVPAEEAEARVAAAIAAGGRLVDDSNAPEWWVLASPDNHGVDIVAWTDS